MSTVTAAGGRDSTVDPETGVSEVKAVTATNLKASVFTPATPAFRPP